MDREPDTGLSRRARRAIPIVAVALTALVVAGILYFRPSTPAPAAVFPSPSALPTLSAQYTADFAFVTPSLGWALIAEPLPTSGTFWVYRTTDGAAHWQKQYAGTAADQIPRFQFFDARNGIVMTGPRSAVRTRDGGAHWVPVGFPQAALAVTFVDAQHGYAFGASTEVGGIDILMTTKDGGATWVEATMPVTAEPGAKGFALAFRPDGEGWFGTSGSDASVLMSTDNGQAWRRITLPYSSPAAPSPAPGQKVPPAEVIYTGVEMLPKSGLLAIVSNGEGEQSAFVTFDRGSTWRAVSDPPSPTRFTDLSFVDSRHWWAFRFGYLFKTADSGVTWKETKVAPLLDNWRYDPVHVIDSGHAWSQMFAEPGAARPAGSAALAMTSDGGASWRQVDLPQPS